MLHRRAQPIHPCLALLRLCTDHAHKRSNSKLHGRCFELFAQLTKVKARIADLEIRLSADAFAPYARRRARVVSQCVGACSWLRRAAATNCGVLSGGPCGLCRRRSPGWFVALVCFTCVLDSQGLGGGALTKRSSAIGIRSIPRPAPRDRSRRDESSSVTARNVPPPFYGNSRCCREVAPTRSHSRPRRRHGISASQCRLHVTVASRQELRTTLQRIAAADIASAGRRTKACSNG